MIQREQGRKPLCLTLRGEPKRDHSHFAQIGFETREPCRHTADMTAAEELGNEDKMYFSGENMPAAS